MRAAEIGSSMEMMMDSEHRHGPDRRRRPRGGRRAADRSGFTPLVFVVDADARRRDVCETILAKLRFAVAPFETADAAVAVMSGLMPDVVAAGRGEYMRLRERMATGPNGVVIPLVLLAPDAAPEGIVDAVRGALRGSVTSGSPTTGAS